MIFPLLALTPLGDSAWLVALTPLFLLAGFPWILAATAALPAIKSLFGGRERRREFDEDQRQMESEWAFRRASYDEQERRRLAFTNFAKAVAQARGSRIPESAFDFLLQRGNQYPAFTRRRYTGTNPWLSALLTGTEGYVNWRSKHPSLPSVGGGANSTNDPWRFYEHGADEETEWPWE